MGSSHDEIIFGRCIEDSWMFPSVDQVVILNALKERGRILGFELAKFVTLVRHFNDHSRVSRISSLIRRANQVRDAEEFLERYLVEDWKITTGSRLIAADRTIEFEEHFLLCEVELNAISKEWDVLRIVLENEYAEIRCARFPENLPPVLKLSDMRDRLMKTTIPTIQLLRSQAPQSSLDAKEIAIQAMQAVRLSIHFITLTGEGAEERKKYTRLTLATWEVISALCSKLRDAADETQTEEDAQSGQNATQNSGERISAGPAQVDDANEPPEGAPVAKEETGGAPVGRERVTTRSMSKQRMSEN